MAIIQITNLNKHGNKRSRIVHHPTTQIGFNPNGFGSYFHVNIFKYDYNHPLIPPGLITLNNKRYIVPGWKEVHLNTTLNDINWVKPKIKKIDKFKSKTWKFDSSSSNAVYTVTQVDSVTLKCSCPGFFRAKDRNLGCKHVQKIRVSLTK
tara:strand:- start:29379 stop:29828 length:450 start_codon:yes stop_codon:yes gene_type:complete